MSIASRIQEIETHIEDVYDTINYSYDTTGVNKNIINIPKYLKKGYIDIINNGIDQLYSNMPKVSEIGSNLSLTPTYEAPMRNREIYGNTYQSGTPTPSSPIPIECATGEQNVEICGKNLKNENNIFNGYLNGNDGIVSNNNNRITYIEIEDNKTYTISKTLSNRFRIGLTNSAPSNNLQVNNYASLDSQTTYTFTNTNYKYLCIWFWTNTDTLTEQQVLNSITIYDDINTYEVNLGKNLIDITTLDYGYVGSNGSIVNSHDAGEMHSTFIKVKPNTTYTFKIFETSTTYNNWFVAGEYSTNDQSGFIIRDAMTTATQNYITFTTSATTQYVRVSARNLENATKVQLEKGNATSYSPYFTPIELNDEDNIKKSSGKNLIQEVVQGSFNFNNGTNTDNATRVRTNVFKVKPNTTYTVSSKIALGECCTYYYENDGTTGIPGIIVVNDTTTKTVSFTTPSNAYYMKIRFGKEAVPYIATDDNNIMLNEGSTALPYEPYGKVWYITKNAIKYNVDTTQLTLISSYSNIEYAQIPKQNNYVGYNSYDQVDILCDRALNIKQAPSGWNDSSLVNKISGNPDKLKWWVGFTKGTGLDAIKTALTGSYIIYPLATPTYEVITNTELINQLEELYTAKSQEGTTNIVVTSENLPMILNASALKNEE